MSRIKRMAVIFIALAAPMLHSADETTPRAALKELAGAWEFVGGEANGEKLTKDDLAWRWTFMADGKAVLTDQKTGTESQYALAIPPSTQPQTINLTYQGPSPALKNMKQFGIYKIENNKLIICLGQPGAAEKDRPKEFAAQRGSGFLMRLQRVMND